MLTCHLYIFFGEVSVKIIDPFFKSSCLFLIVEFESSLYVLGNSPLLYISFANIFSQSVAYL